MRYIRHGIAAIVLLLGACAAEDREAALERLVADAAAAAEARQTAFFRDSIAASYVDARGNDRERMIDLIRGYFLTNPSIDVFSRIENVELLSADAAHLVVLAGLIARRPGEGMLDGFDGRLYRVELELVETGGDWRVIGARWERSLGAMIGD
jgi:hypothetical protein